MIYMYHLELWKQIETSFIGKRAFDVIFSARTLANFDFFNKVNIDNLNESASISSQESKLIFQ